MLLHRKIFCLFLLIAFTFSILLPCKAPAADTPDEETHTITLSYVKTGIRLVSIPAYLERREVEFTSEPDYSSKSIHRSVIPVGVSSSHYIPFAWDRSGRMLYLDFNRNRDLTDDENNAFRAMGRVNQFFKSIPITLQFNDREITYNIDINLMIRNGLRARILVNSFWRGQGRIDGEKWEMFVADDLDGKIGSTSRDVFVLRRSQTGMASIFSGMSRPDPFEYLKTTDNLHLNRNSFKIDYEFSEKDKTPELFAHFHKASPETAGVELKGKYLSHISLEGNWHVLLDRFPENLELPVGTYTKTRVLLEKPGSEYRAMCKTDDPIVIGKNTLNRLAIGGPLQNKIKAKMRITSLVMEYRLEGVGGREFDLFGSSRPGFRIKKDGETIHKDLFDYG